MTTMVSLLVPLACGLLGTVCLVRRAEALSIVYALLEPEQGVGDGESRSAESSAPWRGLRGRDFLAVVMGAVLFAGTRAALCGFSLVAVALAALLGGTAGRLYSSRMRDVSQKREVRRMEFYLPAVMERIVMAVGSGLDIVPALQEASRGGMDPVSAVLKEVVRLSEGGTPVDSAFESVALGVKSVAVRHALAHLALAYHQGGEIVRPLKELSDATQTAYQEGVEEMIAKLPVQAVLPLVVTFTGLIVCFLTVPLMQVGAIASKVAHVTR